MGLKGLVLAPDFAISSFWTSVKVLLRLSGLHYIKYSVRGGGGRNRANSRWVNNLKIVCKNYEDIIFSSGLCRTGEAVIL